MDTDKADGQIFSNEKDIFRLLNNLQQKLAPLSLRIEHSPQVYTSYVLSCDKDKQQLILDELMPKSGNKRLQEGDSFSFESFVDGCRIRAKDLKATLVTGAEEVQFRVNFPAELHFMQRRQSYRAPVRKTLKIPVFLRTKSKQEHQTLLRDFSLEGCQLELSGDQRNHLFVDHTPLYAKLQFPNSQELRLKILILRLRYDEVLKVTLLGCRFLQLTNNQIKEVGLINTELQRDHINFVKNGGHISGIPTLFLPLDEDPDALNDDEEEDEEPNQPVARSKTSQNHNIETNRPSLINQMQQEVERWQQGFTRGLLPSFHQLQSIAEQLIRQPKQSLMAMVGQRQTHNQLACHLLNSAYLMAQAAMQLNKADQQLTWTMAGLCHNLACAGLGAEMITAPRSELSQDQLTNYKQQFQALLKQAQQQQLSKEVLIAISEHRGRLDGSGMPSQLDQSNLHQLGKLMSVISYFDGHSYQVEQLCFYNPGQALKELLNQPMLFDRSFLKLLISLVGLQPIGCAVRLNNDLAGLVLAQNNQQQPVSIRILYNLAENQRLLPADISLSDEGMQVVNQIDARQYGMAQQYLRDLIKL